MEEKVAGLSKIHNNQKKHPFYKSLSFGIPYNVSPFSMSKIIYDYHDMIHDLYTSPFVILDNGKSYTNKDFITDAMDNNPAYANTFHLAMHLRRQYNLNLDVAINGRDLDESSIFALKRYLTELEPTEMTVMENNIDTFRHMFPDMIFLRSHNNQALRVRHFEDKRFDQYIAAKQFLWHPKLWPDDPYKLRLLVNNACLYTCPGCFVGKDLTELAIKEATLRSIEDLVAKTSMMPEDMALVSKYYPNMTFKLNTRNLGSAADQMMKDLQRITPTADIFDRDLQSGHFNRMNSWHKHGSVQQLMKDMDINKDKLLECKYNLQENFKKEAEEMLNTRHSHLIK